MIIDPVEQPETEADSELLAKYIECNDRMAIESLIVRYAPMVASVCRVTTHHTSDAEDAFQATFLVLLQSARKIRKLGSIAAWLHGVAFRISSRARAQRRKQASETSLDRNLNPSTDALACQIDPARQVDPVSLVARKMEIEKLIREMEKLPVRLRATLVEHYLLGFTMQEIASRMDISASAVEGRLRRGRRILRDRLARQGISLSIALGAVSLLQQQLNAAEGTNWCHHFLNHQLNDYFLGLSCNSNSQVSSLVRGEIAMSMRLVALKFSIGFAVVAALGSMVAMGYRADQASSSASGDSKSNSAVVVQNTESKRETMERVGQVILAQNAVPEQVAKDGQQSQAVQPAVQQNEATSKKSPYNTAEKKEPVKVVPWKTPESPTPAWLADSEAEDEILKQVENNRQLLRTRLKAGLHTKSTPLSEVLNQLSDETGCKFFFATSALEAEGLDSDIPVTINLPPCSLRATLNLTLEPLGMTYRVSEAGIQITTQADVDDGEGTLRCYDLSFIFPSSENAMNLVQSIEMSIYPDSWLNAGGTSTICMVGSVMVVCSPEETHYKIEELLRSVAKMNPGNSTPTGSAASPTPGRPGMGGMGGGMF